MKCRQKEEEVPIEFFLKSFMLDRVGGTRALGIFAFFINIINRLTNFAKLLYTF
jgi:hypothetical protein